MLIKRFSKWCESVAYLMGSMSSHHSIEPMEVEPEAEEEVRCCVFVIVQSVCFVFEIV